MTRTTYDAPASDDTFLTPAPSLLDPGAYVDAEEEAETYARFACGGRTHLHELEA